MLPDPSRIEEAVRLLRAGRLVAFPTETVYGLGGDAANPAAVARIFAAKGRPESHPLIVHVSGLAAARDWVREMPEAAVRLAEAFWPGPLTLVLPKAASVLPAVTGGQDTVALRAPAHPVARALLAAFGGGIAAPSANRYGRISPTRAADVHEELGKAVALVLDGGDCDVGLESTIAACLGGRVTLLRPGAVSRSQLEDIVGTVADPDASAPRAPGRLRSHYAPRTPLELVAAATLSAIMCHPWQSWKTRGHSILPPMNSFDFRRCSPSVRSNSPGARRSLPRTPQRSRITGTRSRTSKARSPIISAPSRR